MVQLKYRDIRILDDAFCMHGGYVLDFSNRTFEEYFYDEFNINIYDNRYAINGGSKAKHLRAFIELESSSVVLQVLKSLWKYRIQHPLCNNETIKEKDAIEKRFLQLLEEIENKSDVIQADGVDNFIQDQTLEELVQSIKQYINSNKPHVAVDRLHTYCMKKFAYLILQKDTTVCVESDPLHSRVGKYIQLLKMEKNLTDTSEAIIKSSVKIFDKLNYVRNNQSLAHDNSLLEYHEAKFIFNSINLILCFIRDIEKEKFEKSSV